MFSAISSERERTKFFGSIMVMLVVSVALAYGASLSACKGFEAAPKSDAAAADLADVSSSSGGHTGAV